MDGIRPEREAIGDFASPLAITTFQRAEVEWEISWVTAWCVARACYY